MEFDPNKSIRYYQRYALIQKLKSFYLKQGLKEGRYLRKDEFKNFIQKCGENFEEIAKKHLSNAQLEYLMSIKNPKVAEYHFKQMMKAIIWELSFSNNTYHEASKIFKTTPQAAKEIFIHFKQGLKLEHIQENAGNKEWHITWFREEIVAILETTEDIIRPVLDNIKKVCEYDSVLSTVQNCIHMNTLPKRDRKKVYAERKKFDNEKDKTISFLKKIHASEATIEEIKKAQYQNKHDREWSNYEKTLKHVKSLLSDELILMCGTGKKRAHEISKIIEYI